jgi:hypothetical protein
MGLGSGIRVQGSKRHQIPDPNPQHCLFASWIWIPEGSIYVLFNEFVYEPATLEVGSGVLRVCFMITLWPGLEREEPNLTYEQCTRATGFTLSGLITASRLKGKYRSFVFKWNLNFI